jgi:hypothetical protein
VFHDGMLVNTWVNRLFKSAKGNRLTCAGRGGVGACRVKRTACSPVGLTKM